ncbi:MAG: nickel-binding protein [Polyangiales bacterium]
MEWIVVEREFPKPLTDDQVHRMYDEAQCVDLYRVKGIRSYLSPDRKRLVCVFRAPDAEAVRSFLRVNRSVRGAVRTCSLHTP